MRLKYRLMIAGIKQQELANYCDRGLRIISKHLNKFSDRDIPEYIKISAAILIKRNLDNKKGN